MVSFLLLLLLKQLTNEKRSAKPNLHLKLGEVDLVVITSPDLVCEVFKEHDLKLASRPELLARKLILYNASDFGFAPYGKLWIQLRKICTMELLSVKRVKSFGFIREDEGDRLVESIREAAGSLVNLTEMLLSAASATVARAVFGKECVHERSFLSARKQTNKYLSGFGAVGVFPTLTSLGVIGGVWRGMQRVHRDIDAIFNEIIEEHEAKGLKGDGAGDDIVDVLLKLQSRDIRLISCRNRHLIRNSEIGDDTARPESPFMQKAQAEVRKALKGKTKIKEKDIIKLPYLNNVIKETLKVHPVVSLVHRVFCETVEIGGYTVPAGSRVVVNASAIMRDARCWEDPERFI